MPPKTGVERLNDSKKKKKDGWKKRSQKYYESNKEKVLQVRKARREAQKNGEQYQNRSARKRALDKVRDALPGTSSKRGAIVASLVRSPSTRNHLQDLGLCTSQEQEDTLAIAQATLEDATEAFNATKRRRSNDARSTTNTTLAFLTGERVTRGRLRSKVAQTLNINRKRLTQALQHRRRTLRSDKACWLVNMRKIRSDAIPEEHKKKAYNYWASPEIKAHGKQGGHSKKTIARNTFVSHAKQILEKTQTEAYLQFKDKNPDIKMGQRTFEKCKPFYVIAPRSQDRNTCCCRSHVEMRMVFASCMNFRRKTLLTSDDACDNQFPVYEHLKDLVEETLCPKSNESQNYNKSCLYRSCNECGTSKLNLMQEEQCLDENASKVKWHAFEYMTNDATNQRKLYLATKETSPGEMFNHLKSLLKSFPSHQFRAKLATPANEKFAREPAKRSCLLCTRLFELLMPASGSTSIPVLFPDTGFHSRHYSAQTCHVER